MTLYLWDEIVHGGYLRRNNITKQGSMHVTGQFFFIIYYIMDYRTALEKNLKICFAKLHGRLKKMVFCEKIQTRQTSLWNRYHFLVVFNSALK